MNKHTVLGDPDLRQSSQTCTTIHTYDVRPTFHLRIVVLTKVMLMVSKTFCPNSSTSSIIFVVMISTV